MGAIHAGLECGILGEKFPGMDMVSFGPTIKGAHSPEERVQVGGGEGRWGAGRWGAKGACVWKGTGAGRGREGECRWERGDVE